MKHQFEEAELALMESSRVPFAVYQLIDRRVVTLVLSAGFCELFGYEREEAYYLMDNSMYRDTHPDDRARAADAALIFATEGDEYDLVYRVHAHGKWHVIHACGEHIYTKTGSRLAVVWYTDEGAYEQGDIGAGVLLNQSLKTASREEQLYRQSNYDHLTGLPKMGYFFDLAAAGRDRALANGQVSALLFFNLVGMKHFNRKFGFGGGNALLRSFAEVLIHHYSNEGCGRIAQDNFAAFTTTDRLEETLYEFFQDCTFINGGNTLPVRVGIYLMDDDRVDVSTACDRAKYASIHTSQPHVSGFQYFNGIMLQEIQGRQYIIDSLDRALEERWIQVYYQPIVRATNGRVCDEEALSRWIDPQHGVISPAVFIPVLEDAKLIYKLDLYVLDQILHKMRLQKEAGLPVVPHSLNLSRNDFEMDDLVGEICQRVDSAGVERGLLTIEITESTIGHDFEFMKEQIQRFHALGFEIWMDDFGSGYSSLDVLQSIHFDLIKFDMSFLRRFDKGNQSKIILTELMRMAMGLGMDTVVEGVETREQVDFLREIGCDKLQGYYYCPPVPLTTVFERYEKGIQIGFENPEESDYYETISKVGLYDLSVFSRENHEALQRYFNVIPMALIEVDTNVVRFVRCNNSYRIFVGEAFGGIVVGVNMYLQLCKHDYGIPFIDALGRAASEGGVLMLDEKIAESESVHVIMRRVASNPVTGVVALVVAILSVVSDV